MADHHLTTTVQRHRKMSKKPVVTTNNGLFSILVSAVQNQQNSRCNVCLYCPVVVLRPNAYFQLCQFISCAAKINALSFLFLMNRFEFSFLLNAVFFALLNYDS